MAARRKPYFPLQPPGTCCRLVAAGNTESTTMDLRLACADFTFPLLSHDHALDLVAMLGVEGVDIGLFPDRSHLQQKDFLDNPSQGARELVTKVRDRGLVLADIFHQSALDLKELSENHPDATERKKSREFFLRTLEFVQLCEAPHMTSLPGIEWESDPPGDSLKRASEEQAWRVEKASEAGVVYATEPHMWSVAPTPETIFELLEMTPGLTLTLDYTHYTARGVADAAIEPLWKHASHFHARCSAQDKLQTSLANNTIDWKGVVHAADQADYQGFFGLEYVVMDVEVVEDVDNLSETIRLRDLLEDLAGGKA